MVASTVALQPTPPTELSSCCYESLESRAGACDAVCCQQRATVQTLNDGEEYCLAHFEAVRRG